MKLMVVWCALILGCGVGCGGKPKATRSSKAKDASIAGKAPVDAAAVPVARKRVVDIGGGCACTPLAVGWAQEKALRRALVKRMDGINLGLRGHMAKIDEAVPDEAKDHIAKPGKLHKARRGLACRLDCMLRQFPGATAALWSYLEIAAVFLDKARQTVGRLAVVGEKRPKKPTLAQLTRLFNRTARTSNESIGLALLKQRTPVAELGVNASTFRAKTRRWRSKLDDTLSAFRRQWLPLVRKLRPEGPALSRPVRLRVALARLQQALRALDAKARALACKRGTGCAKPQAKWVAVQRGVQALDKQLGQTATAVRKANPAVSVAQGRRLSDATAKSFAALRKATLEL